MWPKLAQPYLRILLAMICLLLIAACGRDRSSESAGTGQAAADTAPVAPTMPAGKFTAVGEQSILTDTAKLTTTVQTTQSASADAGTVDLSRGEAAYTKNKCGDCHGAKGEGVADKGKAIAGTALSLEEFDKLLRTGGGLGNTHIFGRSAVSPSGMEALYAYVQSFSGN